VVVDLGRGDPGDVDLELEGVAGAKGRRELGAQQAEREEEGRDGDAESEPALGAGFAREDGEDERADRGQEGDEGEDDAVEGGQVHPRTPSQSM
jgi:hypothetical protein